MIFLQQLRLVVEAYLKEYDRNWLRFEQSFNLKNKIQTKAMEENIQSAYMNLRNQQGSDLIAKDFIRTLEKGNILLEYIRKVLTGQTIVTNFTVKGSENEIYLADKSEVPYRLVLSTYGASGNNFVSLAYDINVSSVIKDFQTGIIKDMQKITETDIYSQIMIAKEGYLLDLEQKAAAKGEKKNYPRRYDATDAEIFDLLLSPSNF